MTNSRYKEKLMFPYKSRSDAPTHRDLISARS